MANSSKKMALHRFTQFHYIWYENEASLDGIIKVILGIREKEIQMMQSFDDGSKPFFFWDFF